MHNLDSDAAALYICHMIFKVQHKNVYQASTGGDVETCLIFDVPHAGRLYPKDFKYSCTAEQLRQAEDSYVDQLLQPLAAQGYPFLTALFPRAYIDVNRYPYIKGTHVLNPALVRKRTTPRHKVKIYKNKPSLKDVFNRHAEYYQPYHTRLQMMLDTLLKKQGQYVHLNCHSMPSNLGQDGGNTYDIILGTMHNKTCDPMVLKQLKKRFEDQGYTVGLNIKYFSGAHIVKTYGKPKQGRHSIQVEINRALYMNEETLEKTGRFAHVQQDLTSVFKSFDLDMRQYCKRPVPKLALKTTKIKRFG